MPLKLTWFCFKTRVHVQVRAYELCTSLMPVIIHFATTICGSSTMRQSLNQPQLHSHGSAVLFMVYNPIPVTSYVDPWSNERAGYSKPSARIVLYHPNICPPWLFSCSNIERYSISLWQCGCGMLRIDLTCFENANGLNAPHERSFWKRHIAFAPAALENIARSGQRWNTVVGKTVLYSCLRCVVHWENY